MSLIRRTLHQPPRTTVQALFSYSKILLISTRSYTTSTKQSHPNQNENAEPSKQPIHPIEAIGTLATTTWSGYPSSHEGATAPKCSTPQRHRRASTQNPRIPPAMKSSYRNELQPSLSSTPTRTRKHLVSYLENRANPPSAASRYRFEKPARRARAYASGNASTKARTSSSRVSQPRVIRSTLLAASASPPIASTT